MRMGPVLSAFSMLLEHILCFFKQVAENVFVVLLALFFFEAGKFFKQVFLLGAQVGRRYYFDDDMLIAARAAMHDRHPHTLEAERTVALRAGRDLEHA